MKKAWQVFIFIMKCTLIGFGGGNALLPVIKKEAVDRKKWLSNREFHNLAIATNSIPGPSVVESLSFIAMKQLGKTKGALITILALLPHIFLALTIFILASRFFPRKYLLVIAASLMPVIVGILLAFGFQSLKDSNKLIKNKPLWIFIFLWALLFTLFIPTPYNAPVIVMIGVIAFAYLYSRIRHHKKEKNDRTTS